jgi:hypothetical protein
LKSIWKNHLKYLLVIEFVRIVIFWIGIEKIQKYDTMTSFLKHNIAEKNIRSIYKNYAKKSIPLACKINLRLTHTTLFCRTLKNNWSLSSISNGFSKILNKTYQNPNIHLTISSLKIIFFKKKKLKKKNSDHQILQFHWP